MKNSNTLTFWEYLCDNAIYGIAGALWYKIIFLTIPGNEYPGRVALLYSLTAVMMTLGIIFTFRRRRNLTSVLVNLLLPLELFTLFHLFSEFTVFFAVVTAFAFLLGAAYIITVLKNPVNPRRPGDNVTLLKIRHGLLGARTVTAVVLSLILVPMLADAAFSDPAAESARELAAPTDIPNPDEKTVNDTITKFREETWSSLSDGEKIQALKALADLESYHLGVPYNLTVKKADLKENTLGSFRWSERAVLIGKQCLDGTAATAIETLCHEVYHAVQWCEIEVYKGAAPEFRGLKMFDRVRKIGDEFSNYIDGDEDFFGYYYQECEYTARQYAESCAEYYLEMLEEYPDKTSATISTDPD